mgnify:FL=1
MLRHNDKRQATAASYFNNSNARVRATAAERFFTFSFDDRLDK